jgi:hypothetical protein
VSDDILTHHRPRSVRAVTFVPHFGHQALPLGTRRKQAPHGAPAALSMALAEKWAMNANKGNAPISSGQLNGDIELPFVFLRCVELALFVPDWATRVAFGAL